jgi:hypothetical protein
MSECDASGRTVVAFSSHWLLELMGQERIPVNA